MTVLFISPFGAAAEQSNGFSEDWKSSLHCILE